MPTAPATELEASKGEKKQEKKEKEKKTWGLGEEQIHYG